MQRNRIPRDLCTYLLMQMESCRKDLANDENYDPKTGFKCMDHFKHNRVVAY